MADKPTSSCPSRPPDQGDEDGQGGGCGLGDGRGALDIGSGVAEGACRHLVKDRLEGTGMRWTLPGTQAMLHLRAIYLNGQWNKYVNYRIETEQAALYRRSAA